MQSLSCHAQIILLTCSRSMFQFLWKYFLISLQSRRGPIRKTKGCCLRLPRSMVLMVLSCCATGQENKDVNQVSDSIGKHPNTSAAFAAGFRVLECFFSCCCLFCKFSGGQRQAFISCSTSVQNVKSGKILKHLVE